jgi:23S rRNA pseudouridine2605 synthase
MPSTTKQRPLNSPTSSVRLQKYLASAGVGSRRHCEEYIRDGRVSVDGVEVSDMGTRVEPRRQTIRLDGELVRAEPIRFFLLNKPPGYLCTSRDPEGRPRAIDLLPGDLPRLFTVGRLDEHSEGLLLVTNDGELANRLAHPRYQVPRQYRVQVAGNPTKETLAQLKRGVHFAEGKFRVRGVKRVGKRGKSTFLELVLTEGTNREIRRLLARLGHKVIHLQRVAFGPLKLGRLGSGEFRPLRATELKTLREFVAGRTARKPTKSAKRRSTDARAS